MPQLHRNILGKFPYFVFTWGNLPTTFSLNTQHPATNGNRVETMQKPADRKSYDPEMFETGLPYAWVAVFTCAAVVWAIIVGAGSVWLWHHIDWQGVLDFIAPTALHAREMGATTLIEAAQ